MFGVEFRERSNEYFTDEIVNMSFSIIWALSNHKFYEFIIKIRLNTQYTFQNFLNKLVYSN